MKECFIKRLKGKSWLAYPVLFILVMLISYFIFKKFGLFYTSIESARYMLSAMVQSEAAILAIVVTLSLVAVQLTASSYSPRVIEIFKRSPDLWILMFSYIGAIVYGLGVLKMIGEYKVSVTCSYFLSIFCFSALIPYTLNIINLLKPSTIIDRLSRKITKENLVKEGKEDPIQPIVDIVRGSMMKYDYATIREGLNAMGDKICDIFQKEKFSKDEGIKISKKMYHHFVKLSKLAISRDDEDSAIVGIVNIEKIGKVSAEKGFKGATIRMIELLGAVGKIAADKELKFVVIRALSSLGKVGKAAVNKGLEDVVIQAKIWLEIVEKTAVNKGLEDAIFLAGEPLGGVGVAAADKKLENATSLVVVSLGEVGKAAVNKGLKWTTTLMAESLGKIGKVAANKKSEGPTFEVANSLGEVGKTAADKRFKFATIRAVEYLGVVGKTAVRKELKGATTQAIISLGKIGEAAINRRLEIAIIQAVESLRVVGVAAVDKRFEIATERTIEHLNAIRIAVKNKGFSKEVVSKIDYAIKEINEAIRKSKGAKK